MLWLEDGTESACREVIRLARESGAMDDARAVARDLADRAQQELKILPAGPAKDVLQQLPAISIDRTC